MAFILGFAIFLANSPRVWISGFTKRPGTEFNKTEYMTAPMYGYASRPLGLVPGPAQTALEAVPQQPGHQRFQGRQPTPLQDRGFLVQTWFTSLGRGKIGQNSKAVFLTFLRVELERDNIFSGYCAGKFYSVFSLARYICLVLRRNIERSGRSRNRTHPEFLERQAYHFGRKLDSIPYEGS